MINWHILTVVDYIIIAILSLSTMISLIRGFVREALSVTAWIIALWVALTFSITFSNNLTPYIHNDSLRYGAAFFILFIAVLLLGAFINAVVTSVVHKTGLSGTDRLLGLIFGFGRGVLLVAILLLLGNMTDAPKDVMWKQSQFIPMLQPVEVWLSQYIPEHFRTDVDKTKIEYSNQSFQTTTVASMSEN